MRHFQFMRGGSMSKDTHQVKIIIFLICLIIITECSLSSLSSNHSFVSKVIATNQVESNLSRLNFWSLAHLLLMLIVGVSQVHFHCDGDYDGDYEGDYDDEDNGSYHHRHFLIMFVRAR